MLDETLVVVMGEFGRTPLINPNAGRDHHPRANSLLLAGAGLATGLVIGRTDDRGDSPVERPGHAFRPGRDGLPGARDRSLDRGSRQVMASRFGSSMTASRSFRNLLVSIEAGTRVDRLPDVTITVRSVGLRFPGRRRGLAGRTSRG